MENLMDDKKFKERYLAGEVELEETLAKFLGLNEEEEDVWIEVSDEALKEMLDAQK